MMTFKRKILVAIFLLTAYLNPLKAQNNAPGTDILGFGYDVFGEYANQKSKKRYCLFKYSNYSMQMIGNTQFSVPNKVILENISEHNIKTVSGENMREYAKNLSASVGLQVDALLFSGSVSSSYSFNSSGSEQKFYFTYMDANTKWRISFDARDIPALANILDPIFKKDIDFMDPVKLFETYGTHYIASAYLGGRADFTSESVISQNTSTQDISLAVEAKYKVVSGKSTLNNSQTNTLKNSRTETKLRVIGGNSEFANNISDPITYEKWASGIAGMPVLCDFDKESLRPIWEFASSEKRSQQLALEFQKMCAKRPLPIEIANSMMFKDKFFYIKSKSDNMYWDLPGWHFFSDKQGGKLTLSEKEVNKEGWQSADRFIKILGHATKGEFVFFQPQHSDLVADISGGSKIPAHNFNFGEKAKIMWLRCLSCFPFPTKKTHIILKMLIAVWCLRLTERLQSLKNQKGMPTTIKNGYLKQQTLK